MASTAPTDRRSVLKGNAVVVYLYLLHYPNNYGFNIAKAFEGALPENIRKKRREDEKINKNELKIPLALTQPPHIYDILKRLKSVGLLNFKNNENGKRVLYSVNLEEIGLIPLYQRFPPSFFINLYNSIPSKKPHLDTILSYKKNDYLTVYLHFQAIFEHLSTLLLYINIELNDGLGKPLEGFFLDSGKIKTGVLTIEEHIEKTLSMNINEFEKWTKALKKELIKSVVRENGEKLSEVSSDLILLLCVLALQHKQLIGALCVSESRIVRGISL